MRRAAVLSLHARSSTAHALSADVLVFGESRDCPPFVILKFAVEDVVVDVFLPAHAYNTARSIADLWPRLADKCAAPQPARLPGATCLCSDCDGTGRMEAEAVCTECHGSGSVCVVPAADARAAS